MSQGLSHALTRRRQGVVARFVLDTPAGPIYPDMVNQEGGRMTEEEWLACAEPDEILKSLGDKVSERKLRMFAAACCRRIWELLPDERSRKAVEIAERYADARATDEELETASDAACAVWDEDRERDSTGEGNWEGFGDSYSCSASLAAYNVAIPVEWWGAAPAFVAPDEIAREATSDSRAEGAAQCVLLRDIFGSPFRPEAVDSFWMTWNGGTIPKLAQTIYDVRRFQDLPILADALEEAGCTNADILDHCRLPGEHVLGCWVIDLLLGK
jgi:hypothetical protein